ncbi:hypothetical protein [uncultured Winogradskyella sp.]|uniref:lipase family protein n=1 Tax=uncultured Winogradskyella sp. TaxID=395353 RepID=UPI0026330DAC|nr:hypothetical protein [uncultured Winogradskyella sp.]
MSILNQSQREIMLSFAYMAYIGEQITTPNPEPTIKTNINKAMPQIPPISGKGGTDSWGIVWGPITYTVPGAMYQDNMMYMVQNNNDKTQFTLAIRGTNFVSQLNWLMEDFDVLQQMPWPITAKMFYPMGAMISEGASMGLQILLNMKGEDTTGVKIGIIDCLTNYTKSVGAINLCVTGHSLGGMLCGTLALYLQDTISLWDTSSNSNISSISFAAPSAGNTAFANHSDKVFSSLTPPPNWDKSLGTNMDRVACDLDGAPYFYTASNIYGSSSSPLFNIYDYPSGGKPGIDGMNFTDLGLFSEWTVGSPLILGAIANQLKPKDYLQIENSAIPIKGKFIPTTSLNPPYDIVANKTTKTYLEAFAGEIAYQHSDSYPTILGVTELLNPAIIIKT